MEWAAYIDGYCERLAPGLWAEPLNALTNAAFVIAAYVMWRRLRGQDLGLGMVLVAILALIGVGSFLFHTFATQWSMLADIVPIGIFILVYIYAMNRDLVGLPPVLAALGVVAFVPYAAVMTPLFNAIAFLSISNFYWSVPLLIALYAVIVGRRAPATGRGLAIGAAFLVVSITIRSLDMPLCGALPIGTHFLWHTLNGIILAWMIEVYRRHMLEAAK